MMDEQYAHYQCQFQAMNNENNNNESGPSDKMKGKQPKWAEHDIPGISPEELNMNTQERVLEEYKQKKPEKEDIPPEKKSGYDWHSQHLEGNEKFS